MQPLLHQLAADTAHLANKEAWQVITAKIAKDGLRGRRGGAVARAVWATDERCAGQSDRHTLAILLAHHGRVFVARARALVEGGGGGVL